MKKTGLLPTVKSWSVDRISRDFFVTHVYGNKNPQKIPIYNLWKVDQNWLEIYLHFQFVTIIIVIKKSPNGIFLLTFVEFIYRKFFIFMKINPDNVKKSTKRQSVENIDFDNGNTVTIVTISCDWSNHEYQFRKSGVTETCSVNLIKKSWK